MCANSIVNSSSAVLYRSSCELQVGEAQRKLMLNNFNNNPFT